MDGKKLTDEKLIKKSREGDKEAMDILLQRYKGFVREKSRPYFLQGADREDIIQEGMIGLYKAINDYDMERGASFYTFAALSIEGQIISAVRKASRKKHQPLNEYISFEEKTGDENPLSLLDIFALPMPSPEDIVVGDNMVFEIEKALDNRLSPLEKNVLELYLDNDSYDEIALTLNIDVKAVDNALQRVRGKLSIIIDDLDKGH